MKNRWTKGFLFLGLMGAQILCGQEAAQFEDPADYPLMGDWEGRWIDPLYGHEKIHPELAAQILPMGGETYRVALLPELYNRSEPYLDVIIPGSPDRIELAQAGFTAIFEGDRVEGEGLLHGHPTAFELVRACKQSPTLGMAPPEGAVVLFDGSSVDHWEHLDDRPFSWTVRDGVLEVNSEFWNGGENKEKGIGGLIGTRESFGSFKLHLEFRYPVEEGKTGQERGNSGIFLHPVGEIQILNSYMTAGYNDECGSIYRRIPPQVNAAGPPLQWQTYDIVLKFLPDGEGACELTVRLNGRIVQNRRVLESPVDEVKILLQDHINRIQFRNIWLLPL